MIYPIVKFGDPVLEKPAASRSPSSTTKLRKLADDMFESMYAAHGVGLAAPQIGISKRIAVIDVTFKEDPEAKIVLVEPGDRSRRRTHHLQRRLPQPPGVPREGDARADASRRARRILRARPFEVTGEELLARALAARNRPPQRQALHQPHQRAEARPDEAQDPQAGESRASGRQRHDGPGLLRHSAFAVPTLEKLVAAGFRVRAGGHAAGPPQRTRHGAGGFAGQAGGAGARPADDAARQNQEQRRFSRRSWSASRRKPSSSSATGASFRSG